MSLIAVFTTVANRDDARDLARSIVERGLAACAQIADIESFYTWEGSVHDEPECRILFKTTAERYAEIEVAILEMHTYDLPAIYSVAIDAVHAPYADWVVAGSRGS